MRRALGSLVVDEQIVPITELRLDRGAFWLTAEIRGPAPAVDSTDYVLIGSDGEVVYRSTGHNRVRWPRLGRGDAVVVEAEVRAAGKVSRAP